MSRCQHQPSSRSSLQPSVASANVNGNGQLQRGSPAWHVVGAARKDRWKTANEARPWVCDYGLLAASRSLYCWAGACKPNMYNAGMRKGWALKDETVTHWGRQWNSGTMRVCTHMHTYCTQKTNLMQNAPNDQKYTQPAISMQVVLFCSTWCWNIMKYN